MKITRYAIGAVLALASLVAAAEGGGPCRADVQKYCAQAQGGKQVEDCLLDHQKDVSDACYDGLKQRLQGGGQGGGQRGGQGGGGDGAMQACKPDFEKYCKNVEPGGGRIVNCLLDHQKDLSDACYDSLAKKKGGRKN